MGQGDAFDVRDDAPRPISTHTLSIWRVPDNDQKFGGVGILRSLAWRCIDGCNNSSGR